LSYASSAFTFHGLLDLACSTLGGEVLLTSDDFFAEAQAMLAPGPAVFIPDRYTERGKWMDGWESRRKRTAGHDFCLIELGVAGRIHAFDIDTSFFHGNHPAFASVEGVQAPVGATPREIQQLPFEPLVQEAPLAPNAHNLFVAGGTGIVSHLRLNIFPDGGVARFRAFGRASRDWQTPDVDAEARAHVLPGWFNLAALENGAEALACSDAHFGAMNHLIQPGRAENMGSGWETRRRRGPGHDFIVVRLAERGVARLIEVDTRHFKGNFPERCALDGIDAPGARPSELVATSAWRTLIAETRLQADFRHFLASSDATPVTHVRLRIFPDGGVSRLRIWGEREPGELRPSPAAVAHLNELSPAAARDVLKRACGATGWVEAMLNSRPFASSAALLARADTIWRELESRDYLEAFSHHPEIGANQAELRERFASTAALSEREQLGAAHADEATLQALRDKNRAYREKFGHVFIVCASGKTASQMLTLLEQRLENSSAVELAIAAAEQAKITRLRLERLEP
jgi:allantoicase